MWKPQRGPQKALIDCPVSEIFYGGARGGGKTDGVLGKAAARVLRNGGHENQVIFRKELTAADDIIERSGEIFGPLGARWNAQKTMWRWPNGARTRFRPLEKVRDADKYQGQNITFAPVEESGQYPDSGPIDRLLGVLRSVQGIKSQLLLTGNPGGPGQGWLKARFVDPAPEGMKVIRVNLPSGGEHSRVYIPSRVSDNRKLMAHDPNYVDRLHLVGSAELVRAWLQGDWDAIEGAYFDEWDSSRHVVEPFAIPKDWTRFLAFDWGSARPFSVGWWAVAGDDTPLSDGRVIPRGALVRYREWYGCQTDNQGQVIPNQGIKLTAEQVGEGIAQRSRDEPLMSYGVADPAAFAEDGGPSIMERITNAERQWHQRNGTGKQATPWRPADNKRVAQDGHVGGWDQMRQRLRGDEFPMLFVFKTCSDFQRTVPRLQHDPNRPEDLDTESEDHIADETRYACMSRPWIKQVTETQSDVPPDLWGRKRNQGSSWLTS